MSEFEKLFGEEFFIIDSNNLMDIKTKFYGFSIIDNNIVFENSFIDENKLTGNGAYLFVKDDDGHIRILQDFNGCYGLYFYKSDDYFAISNSFIKLVEYLSFNDYFISFNQEYAEAFLFAELCSYAYEDTLINEIKLLPKNYIVDIDKFNNCIQFNEIDYKEKSVCIDSQEGFDILDEWYFRWVELFRSIKKDSNYISIDLSGGFDSRVIAALWLNANIDLNKVRIKSFEDKLYCHNEDYIIASKIAEEFDFKLNKNLSIPPESLYNEFLTPMDISFYTKLGFHKEMYYSFSKFSEPFYTIAGLGGESIRGYPNQTPDQYLNHVRYLCNFDDSLMKSTENIVKKSWSKIDSNCNIDKNSFDLLNKHYMDVRSRNHFGKATTETYFTNVIALAPLMDPELYKLNLDSDYCEDSIFLFALIYTRYCPRLLDFEFEGNREISEETREYAKKLNEKYPFKSRDYDFISGPPKIEISQQEPPVFSKQNLENRLKEVFYTPSFKSEFEKIFSDLCYFHISEVMETEDFYPLKHFYAAFSAVLVNNLISNKYKTLNDLLNYYFDSETFDSFISRANEFRLLKYNTIRIDVKCYGENNEIEIINNSDKYCEITNPSWFRKKEGVGFIVESFNGEIDLKIKCINSDKFKLRFGAINSKDKLKNKFPVYVDYTEITINNESILDENKLIWDGKPLIYEKELTDSILDIHVKWQPFTSDSLYNNEFKEKFDNLNKKYKKLKKENVKLKNQLQDVFDSNSWKLTENLRKIKRFLKKIF